MNASLQDECGLALPEPNATIDWRNLTSDLDTSPPTGYNVTWKVPLSYPRGPSRIIANASIESCKINESSPCYDSGEDNVTLLIYGWSMVSLMNPYNTSIYASSVPAPITCLILDANHSLPVADTYPVYFWKDKGVDQNATNLTINGTALWN
jgi:hypothetical protein